MHSHVRTPLGFALIVAAIASFWFVIVPAPDAAFPGLVGPAAPTRFLAVTDYPAASETLAHGHQALALLVTDEQSSWYGLVSGFKSIGIPVVVTRDVTEALRHRVVVAYPQMAGSNLDATALRALADHVRGGGTLVGFSVLGGGMPALFGFGAAEEVSRRGTLRFDASEAINAALIEAEDRVVEFSRPDAPEVGIPAIVYRDPKHPPLAVFEDGAPAIVHNWFESVDGIGHAYAFGVDLGHLLLRGHGARFNEQTQSYVNTYAPKLDSLLRLLVAIYREGEPDAVLLSPTPAGKGVTVLMTHDVDFIESIDNIPAYADVERRHGVPATFFIQTKYVQDFYDKVFFDDAHAPIVRALATDGMEVASHSVSHSRVFSDMEAGTGEERYPDYQPFVASFTETRGASLSGELRVSKFLLEQAGGVPVVSFRPGHLSLPESLPQMLEAHGFAQSSSITANQAMSHLPFRAMYDRLFAVPVNVYEFPVTIEDEIGSLYGRLEESIAITRRIARYRGLVTLLVHTDTLGEKLRFVDEYLGAIGDSAWYGTVNDYGQWWRAREYVAMRVARVSDTERRLDLDAALPLTGLTLDLPAGWALVEGPPGARQAGTDLVLDRLEGTATLRLRVPPRTTP